MMIQMNKGGMIVPSNFPEAIEFAKLIAHSGFVPKQFDGNPGAVLVAVQMGAEIGLSPMAALQNIAVINGRPSIYGDAMLAVVVDHKDFGGIKEDDLPEISKKGSATCVLKRKGFENPVTSTYTVELAKKAGLWGKQGPWTNYPERMLKMRARAFAIRDMYPDVIRGLSMAEEAQDIIDQKPEWQERREPADLAEGLRTFGARKPTPQPVDAEVVPDHDPDTGEVQQAAPAGEDWSKVGPPSMTPEEVAEAEEELARETKNTKAKF